MRWIASKKATWQQCSMNWKPKASPIPHLYNHCHAARYHTQELGNLQQGDVPFPWGRYFQDLKATFAAETPANLSQILPFKCSHIFLPKSPISGWPYECIQPGHLQGKESVHHNVNERVQNDALHRQKACNACEKALRRQAYELEAHSVFQPWPHHHLQQGAHACIAVKHDKVRTRSTAVNKRTVQRRHRHKGVVIDM